MDQITRKEIKVVLQLALNDVESDLIRDIINKPGQERFSDLCLLDTLKRLETRINARLDYDRPDGTQ